MSLPDHVKIWLTSVYSFLLKFCPKVIHPLLILALEKFGGKLRPNGQRWRSGHNGEPIGNHHCSFEWYDQLPPVISLLAPQLGYQMNCVSPASWHVLPSGESDRGSESWLMSTFAKSLWPLFSYVNTQLNFAVHPVFVDIWKILLHRKNLCRETFGIHLGWLSKIREPISALKRKLHNPAF